MTKKEITICGKQVNICYCAAVEQGFENLRNKGIGEIDFGKQEDLMALSLSSIVAAYARANEEAPVSSDDILYDATPEEIIELFTAVLELRNGWYGVPKVVKDAIDEESDAKENEESEKN